jgi:hypothetical protein
LTTFSFNIYASNIEEAPCFVQGKIINISSNVPDTETIQVKITHTGSSCPVKSEEVYEVTNNVLGIFQIDVIISAHIREGSSMESNGVVEFLLWSDVLKMGEDNAEKYELQSSKTPIINNTTMISESKATTVNKEYLIYGAYFAIIMVIASSISQIQKYLEK